MALAPSLLLRLSQPVPNHRLFPARTTDLALAPRLPAASSRPLASSCPLGPLRAEAPYFKVLSTDFWATRLPPDALGSILQPPQNPTTPTSSRASPRSPQAAPGSFRERPRFTKGPHHLSSLPSSPSLLSAMPKKPCQLHRACSPWLSSSSCLLRPAPGSRAAPASIASSRWPWKTFVSCSASDSLLRGAVHVLDDSFTHPWPCWQCPLLSSIAAGSVSHLCLASSSFLPSFKGRLKLREGGWHGSIRGGVRCVRAKSVAMNPMHVGPPSFC